MCHPDMSEIGIQWRHQGGGGIKGHLLPPPSEAPPLSPPPSEEKMVKISHFRQNFGFLPLHTPQADAVDRFICAQREILRHSLYVDVVVGRQGRL